MRTTKPMDPASVSARAAGRTRRKSRALDAGRHSKTNRREDAEARQEVRDKRSNKEQIRMLDERLGKGKGAQRERARLN